MEAWCVLFCVGSQTEDDSGRMKLRGSSSVKKLRPSAHKGGPEVLERSNKQEYQKEDDGNTVTRYSQPQP